MPKIFKFVVIGLLIFNCVNVSYASVLKNDQKFEKLKKLRAGLSEKIIEKSQKTSPKKSKSATPKAVSAKSKNKTTSKKVTVRKKENSPKKITELPPPKIIKEVNGEKLSDFYSNSAYVFDNSDNKVIFDKNSDLVAPIASVTKLMMAMVVLDANLDMDEVLTISDEDIDYLRNSRSHLSVGFRIRRGHALLLALMSSDNRAANALARYYPTGYAGFVRDMRTKAQKLGMHSTNFEDATGLHNGNVSTPRDLALMVSAAYTYPKIREYTTTQNAQVRYLDKTINFVNTNPEIRKGEESLMNIVLSKTGYIREAGFCLVMTALVRSKEVTIVLMDAKSSKARALDIANVQNWINSVL